ncbi:MAG TPA: sodium:proton antiporter [Usitatibacter sp.]|nr:sodium:proton antiporter [Usitatibacter sp.]
MEIARHLLLTLGIILAAGAALGAIARRLRIPDVALFLVAGILLGPAVSGLVVVRAGSALNQVVLVFGACYILFDGGASLRFAVLKETWITIVALATAGVIVTGAITAAAAWWLLGIPFIAALLLGAAIASTDPATLVPVFRQVRVRARVAQTVIAESALNDATGAIATFAVLGVALGTGAFSVADSLSDLARQAGLGLGVGAILGYLAALATAHARVGILGEYAPVVTLVAVIGAYLAADGLQASGFMAVFALGVVFGNKDALGLAMPVHEQEKLDDFVATTALVMRMFIFILLGTQVDFGLMDRYLAAGTGVVAVLMLVARPVAVFACALPDRRARWSLAEMLLMCWTRETGAIPGALAGLLMGMNAPEAPVIASVTFIAILVTLLVQATTTRWLAGRLGLLEER